MKVIKMINEYLLSKKSVQVKPEFNELEYLESKGLSISHIHLYLSRYLYSLSSNFYIKYPEIVNADILSLITLWMKDFKAAYPMVQLVFKSYSGKSYIFDMTYKGVTTEIKCELHNGGTVDPSLIVPSRDVRYGEILKLKAARAYITDVHLAEYLGINLKILDSVYSGETSITSIVTFEALDKLFQNTPGNNESVYNNTDCSNLKSVVLKDPKPKLIDLTKLAPSEISVWETKLGYPPSVIVKEVCDRLIERFGNGFSPEFSLPFMGENLFPEVTFKAVLRYDLTTDLYVSYRGSRMVLNVARQNAGIKYRHVSKDMEGVVQQDPVQNTDENIVVPLSIFESLIEDAWKLSGYQNCTLAEKAEAIVSKHKKHTEESITVPLDYFTSLVDIASEHGYPMAGDGYDLIKARKPEQH